MPILSSKNKFITIMLWAYGGLAALVVLSVLVMMVVGL